MLLAVTVVHHSFLRLGGFILLLFEGRSLLCLGGATAEEDPLRELPGFDAGEEDQRGDDHDGPLPGDHLVLEDDAVDDGDVERREDGDEAEDNGPEEEFVAADVVHPALGVVSANHLFPNRLIIIIESASRKSGRSGVKRTIE